MITITRRLALHLRAVLRRAFGIRGPYPSVCLRKSPTGIRIQAKSIDVAVEYHTCDGGGPEEPLWIPVELLADCEGKKDDPVEIQPASKGRVTAQWRDGNVPQIIQYDVTLPAEPDIFPGLPDTLVENPVSILDALHEAGETRDPGSVRFALGCLRLRAKNGEIAATDGRQLIVQSGFTFPWQGDLLVPWNKVLTAPEIRQEEPVEIGKAGDWVAFRIGEWTVWLAINKDGRFPNVSCHIPRVADATATCRLSPADASFLAETLPRLPSDDQLNYPVTLDLNGSVAIRSKPADQDQITELVLRNSSWSGEPVRINMNRQYLARAAKLGFQEVHLYGPSSAVLCQDGTRQYVWALLDPESAHRPYRGPHPHRIPG